MKSVTAREAYRGEDDGSEIVILAGETVDVSDAKADQLERDFPEQFAVDASKKEREEIEAEVAARDPQPEVAVATGINARALIRDLEATDDPRAAVEQLSGEEAKAVLVEITRQSSLERDVELAGDALHDRAAELDIEGRSSMSADELREAVAEAEDDLSEQVEVQVAPAGAGTVEHIGKPNADVPPEEEKVVKDESADPKAQRAAAKRRSADEKKRKARGKRATTSKSPRTTAE